MRNEIICIDYSFFFLFSSFCDEINSQEYKSPVLLMFLTVPGGKVPPLLHGSHKQTRAIKATAINWREILQHKMVVKIHNSVSNKFIKFPITENYKHKKWIKLKWFS